MRPRKQKTDQNPWSVPCHFIFSSRVAPSRRPSIHLQKTHSLVRLRPWGRTPRARAEPRRGDRVRPTRSRSACQAFGIDGLLRRGRGHEPGRGGRLKNSSSMSGHRPRRTLARGLRGGQRTEKTRAVRSRRRFRAMWWARSSARSRSVGKSGRIRRTCSYKASLAASVRR